jgi:hypothetical protein
MKNSVYDWKGPGFAGPSLPNCTVYICLDRELELFLRILSRQLQRLSISLWADLALASLGALASKP